MDPKDRGERSEAQILARFVERGYSVLTPWGDNQRYDLVLDLGSEFVRVQCKTARLSGRGGITFSCQSVNWNTKTKKDYRGEVDIFAVYSPDLDNIFILPVEDVGTTACTLRYKMPKNNQKKGVAWATDYLF